MLFELHILRPELETPAEECGNDGIDGNRFDIGGYAGGIRLGSDAGVDDQVCLYRQLDDGEDDARLYAGSSIHCYHL